MAILASYLCLDVFPACWRQANVTSIPKGPSSSSVVNYLLISITAVLLKVFKRLVSVRLGLLMERSGEVPTIQFASRKSVGICVVLLCVFRTR